MAFLLGCGLAMAQSEPSLNAVYATAQEGKLDQAQVMMQQVLIAHPNSAKAYFVQSELYARQGNMGRAHESLAKAEKLAPGLPFAKPEAVQALRARLNGTHSSGSATPPTVHAAAPQPSSSWLVPAALAAAVVALGYLVFRKKAPVQSYGPPSWGSGNGSGSSVAMQPPFGQPQYGAAGYGQPGGSGLGGKIMGGVATGLAVGAGVMAAEAIGRNLMGHNANAPSTDNFGNNTIAPQANNYDMGGQDFGVNDAGTWDDAGSIDSSGGDWDN